MALEYNVAAGQWFIGEDKIIETTVFAADGVTPIDVTGWKIKYVLSKTDKAETPLVEKGNEAPLTGVTIVGTFSATPASNTQRVRITFISADTDPIKEGTYRHSLKRTDSGSENILFYGNATLSQATAH